MIGVDVYRRTEFSTKVNNASSLTSKSSLAAAALPPMIRDVHDFSAPGRRPIHRRLNVGIHGARGLLALFVFTFHVAASGVPGFSWQTSGLAHAAIVSLQFSVEIFFCISGYVVTATLSRSHGPGAFLRNRAMRILPVLWVTLAVLVPFGLLTRQGVFATLTGRDLAWVLPGNLVPLAGAMPIPIIHIAAWSLSYELLFYIAAAALWWLPTQQHLTRSLIIAGAAGLVVWHPRAVFFGVGVCVARTDIATHPWVRHAIRSPSLMLASFFACWYMVQFGGITHEGTLLDWAVDGRINLAAAAVGFGVLAFVGIVAGEGWLGVVVRTRPLQRLGTISFSFYLWHVIVIGIVKRVLAITCVSAWVGPWSQVVLAVVCLPICLIVANLSARFIERDLLAWLRRPGSVATVPV